MMLKLYNQDLFLIQFQNCSAPRSCPEAIPELAQNFFSKIDKICNENEYELPEPRPEVAQMLAQMNFLSSQNSPRCCPRV